MSKVVNAAVAVLLRADGQVLIAQRPEGKPWAGWWEFPGGKIESGETALEALKREVEEELGSTVTEAYPWLTRHFDYPDRSVNLHFFIVRGWQGEPHGREGQQLVWQFPDNLTVSPMLPANEPILNALCLPSIYAITNLAERGEALFFIQLEASLKAGLKLIQVREKHLSAGELKIFAQRVMQLSSPYSAKVLINADIDLALEVGADGVHLTSDQLSMLDAKPEGLLCGASCHHTADLEAAARLGVDFVVLSPVMNTQSHPEVVPLGWAAFSKLIEGYTLPVYALGGLSNEDLQQAWISGAHGIAMQRSVWQDDHG
ncbi:MAG: Nudix family hydrolase [Methylophilaceae bacterium]